MKGTFGSTQKLTVLIAGLCVLLAAGSATAATTVAGVKFPDNVTVGNQTLVLNGAGLREKFWIDVYAGALYLPHKATTADAVLAEKGPTRITMHLLHDISHNQFADAWNHDFRKNNSDQAYQAVKDRLERFNGFFPDSKDGQQIVIDYVPGTGTSVSIDGKQVGTVAGADFHTALMRVFVGDHPPTDAIKAGFLGKQED